MSPAWTVQAAALGSAKISSGKMTMMGGRLAEMTVTLSAFEDFPSGFRTRRYIVPTVGSGTVHVNRVSVTPVITPASAIMPGVDTLTDGVIPTSNLIPNTTKTCNVGLAVGTGE